MPLLEDAELSKNGNLQFEHCTFNIKHKCARELLIEYKKEVKQCHDKNGMFESPDMFLKCCFSPGAGVPLFGYRLQQWHANAHHSQLLCLAQLVELAKHKICCYGMSSVKSEAVIKPEVMLI